MVDVAGLGQSVIYEHTEKLETGALLNLRTREVYRGGRWTLALGEWMRIHLVLSALSCSSLFVNHLLARS